jgi:hypothetical protein
MVVSSRSLRSRGSDLVNSVRLFICYDRCGLAFAASVERKRRHQVTTYLQRRTWPPRSLIPLGCRPQNEVRRRASKENTTPASAVVACTAAFRNDFPHVSYTAIGRNQPVRFSRGFRRRFICQTVKLGSLGLELAINLISIGVNSKRVMRRSEPYQSFAANPRAIATLESRANFF